MRLKRYSMYMLLIFIFSILLIISGCDIFYTNFFYSISGSGSTIDYVYINDYKALVEKGKYFLKEGKYDVAYEYFSKALEVNPKGSVALEGKLTALLFMNFSLDYISNEILPKVSSLSTTNPADYVNAFELFITNPTLYSVSKEIQQGLSKIIYRQMDGEIPENDPTVNLDFIIFNTIYQLLFFIDDSENTFISTNEDLIYRLMLLSAEEGFIIIPPESYNDILLNIRHYKKHFSNTLEGMDRNEYSISLLYEKYTNSEILEEVVKTVRQIKTNFVDVWYMEFEKGISDAERVFSMITNFVGATNLTDISEITQLITNILDVWTSVIEITNKITNENVITNYITCVTNEGVVICWITNTN